MDGKTLENSLNFFPVFCPLQLHAMAFCHPSRGWQAFHLKVLLKSIRRIGSIVSSMSWALYIWKLLIPSDKHKLMDASVHDKIGTWH